MAISIINNSTAIGAQGSVNNANNSLTKTLKALSTGLRINSAADDASGLAVSEKLRGQISGLEKAASNAQDAISLLQTAEGAMGSMTSMIQRIRELAVQAGDPAYTSNDRAMLQLEVDQLKEEIDRVSNTTEFNTKKLLNGDAAGIWSYASTAASSASIEAIIKGAPAAGDYNISATISSGTAATYSSNIFTRVSSANSTVNVAASAGTTLNDIVAFKDANGNNILANTQILTIYAGNGESAEVVIQGDMTLDGLQSALNTAMQELGLGASGNNTLVSTTSSGAFTFQASATGSFSELSFAGDEDLINALGIHQTSEATDGSISVNITDTDGTTLASGSTNDGRVRNLIDGVDIDIQSYASGTYTFRLHVKDNATKAAVGANEGQVLDISIGRLDTKSLDIDGVNVATFDAAQNSISKLDYALEQISKARATAGAQMNRLEYTISNLNTTRENMVAAESRIRDLDIAQASSDLAAQQVLMQSATAMLAQANQIPSYAMTLLS